MKEIVLEEGEEIKEYEYRGTIRLITNYGRIFNEKGIELKPRINCGVLCVAFSIRKENGKWEERKLNLARCIYKLFIDNNLSDDCLITYKDKNRFNVRYDNLELSILKRKVISNQIKEIFLTYINSLKTRNIIKQALMKYYDCSDNEIICKGMTLEDLIQETHILVYKSLTNFEGNDSYSRFICLIYRIIKSYIVPYYKYEKKGYYNDTRYYKNKTTS